MLLNDYQVLMQLEQELAMITERTNVKDAFLREWTRYVPAVISLGKKSSKKNIKEVIKNTREEGMVLYSAIINIKSLL